MIRESDLMALFDSLPRNYRTVYGLHACLPACHHLQHISVCSFFFSFSAATSEQMVANWRGRVIHTGGILDVVDNTLGKLYLVGGTWGKR